MALRLLTELNLEFLSLKGGYRGSSESTHVKMPHCWKSRARAHIKPIVSVWMTVSISMIVICFTLFLMVVEMDL